MICAWICTVLLLSGFNLQSKSKLETVITTLGVFSYLSILVYFTYLYYTK